MDVSPRYRADVEPLTGSGNMTGGPLRAADGSDAPRKAAHFTFAVWLLHFTQLLHIRSRRLSDFLALHQDDYNSSLLFRHLNTSATTKTA